MDEFAKALLQRARRSSVAAAPGESSGEGGQPPVEATIAEQVSTFNAVREWVRIKHKIDPDDEPTDFVAKSIKRISRNSPATRRRRNSHDESDDAADDHESA